MMTGTTDAIIIGGGVYGASLAFHLTQGGLKPTVLERKVLASGATGRSSGLVRMHDDFEPECRLAWASYDYFQNWLELVGGDCGFTRTGFLELVPPEFEEHLRANVAIHQRLGVNTRIITADDVRQLCPELVTGDFEVAAYEADSGYADPSSTTLALMQAARERGARLIQECEVTAIHTTDSRVTGVETTQSDFSAPIVINSAGAWAADIGRLVGLDLPIDTWRHDTMFIRRPPKLAATHPTVIDEINAMYFRSESGGLTLVGLEDDNPMGQDPDSDAGTALPGFVERAVERICLRLPGMEYGSLHSAHAGYDGITPDCRSILDQAGPEGFYLACGFSGTGFKLAPAVGKCMTELILHGQARTVDISPFNLGRFAGGRLLIGDYPYAAVWR